MKASIKNLFQLAGLKTDKGSHLCTYTIEPESKTIVFFYVGVIDTTNGTKTGNAFIAFHGIPKGCTFPTNEELERALTNWLKYNTPQPYDISMVYSRMRDELEINERLSNGETVKEIINSQNTIK